MRFAIIGAASVLAIAAAAAAQPAWAVQGTAEITGTATVVDTTGFTGPPNTTYNTTFDLTFFVNDAPGPGVTVSTQTNEPPFTIVHGLISHGSAMSVQADLSFGYGGDLSFGFDYGGSDGDAFGEAARALLDPTAGYGAGGVLGYFAQTTIEDPDFNLMFNLNFEMLSPTNFGQGSSVDYNKPFTYTFGPDDQVLDAEGVYQIDCGSQQCLQTNLTFSLNPETITVTSNEGLFGGVPEPTTWALMIGGFGGVGAALRRRKGPAPAARLG